MAHVHDKQRIKMGNKTWPMYMINESWKLKISTDMVNTIIDELRLSHVHDKQRIKISTDVETKHGPLHDKQRIKMGNKTWLLTWSTR